MKVVVRKPPDAMTNAGRAPIRDRATGELATAEDATGTRCRCTRRCTSNGGASSSRRTSDSGSDEAAAARHAVRAREEAVRGDRPRRRRHVRDGIAARKVLSLSPTTGTNEQSIQQSPYRWTAGADTRRAAVLGAEFVGNALNGKPAEFAGDPRCRARSACSGSSVRPRPARPIQYVFAELKKRGVKVAQDLTYTLPTDTRRSRRRHRSRRPR